LLRGPAAFFFASRFVELFPLPGTACKACSFPLRQESFAWPVRRDPKPATLTFPLCFPFFNNALGDISSPPALFNPEKTFPPYSPPQLRGAFACTLPIFTTLSTLLFFFSFPNRLVPLALLNASISLFPPLGDISCSVLKSL